MIFLIIPKTNIIEANPITIVPTDDDKSITLIYCVNRQPDNVDNEFAIIRPSILILFGLTPNPVTILSLSPNALSINQILKLRHSLELI